MPSRIRLVLILSVALAAAASPHAVERSGKKAFLSAWVGRSVVVKRALYSVVYDERSRVVPLIKHKDRVTGLTVVTPTGASYLTVKWPTPLSDELTESSLIDAALARFVTRVESVDGND